MKKLSYFCPRPGRGAVASAGGGEPSAAELAVLDQPDEERQKLLVFLVLRLAERGDGLGTQGAEPALALAEDDAPLRRHVLGLDVAKPRVPEEPPVAVETLERGRRHPAREPLTLALVEARS